MSTGSDFHEPVTEKEDLFKYLSLLSQSQGGLNFSRAIEKIYTNHFIKPKNIGESAFADEWRLSERLDSFQEMIRNEKKICARLLEMGDLLEKIYFNLK